METAHQASQSCRCDRDVDTHPDPIADSSIRSQLLVRVEPAPGRLADEAASVGPVTPTLLLLMLTVTLAKPVHNPSHGRLPANTTIHRGEFIVSAIKGASGGSAG